MNTLGKAIAGTLVAATMAVTSASPALAHERRGGIDAGDVIAGALVVGGIAAIASAASKDKDRYGYGEDRDYRDYRYDRAGYRDGYRAGNPREAVSRCVRAVERDARGRVEVTRITDVRDWRDGFEVRGRVSMQEGGYRWRSDRYDGDRFTCVVRHGRVADIDYSGMRSMM